MVRFGIIGAGTMGQAHTESITFMPGSQLIAIADPAFEKARQLAEPVGAVPLPEAGELIVRNDIDAVVVASPTPLHFQHAKMALEQGKPVFLELPMVRHLEEGEKLLQFAAEKNAVLTVGHSLRAFHEYKLIKEKVDAGSAGKVGTIRLGRRTSHPRSWYSNFESSGGVVLDSMIHEFDYLLWVFGTAKRIFCQGMHGRSSTDNLDYALSIIRLESGAIAHIESSWCHYGQFSLDAEIAGDQGLIHYHSGESISLELSMIDWNTGGRQYVTHSPVITPACYKILEAFAHAVEGKGENPVSGEEGLAAVKLALAAIESMETKQSVTLSN